MEIKIFTKDLDSSESLNNYIKSKIEDIERHLGKSDGDEKRYCDFRIGKVASSSNKGKNFFAEATIVTSKKNFGARVEAESVNEAVDKLKDELALKIRKYKGKKESLVKKGGRKIKNLLRGLMK